MFLVKAFRKVKMDEREPESNYVEEMTVIGDEEVIKMK